MLLFELISELRSNPAVNVTTEYGHAAAVKYLKGLGKDLKDYGVSMTDIPKLGVFPRSKYNTPLGIYFYPADYYVAVKEKNRNLAFQDDAAYIQIFEINGEIEYIKDMHSNAYEYYLKKLHSLAPKIARLINQSPEKTAELIDDAVKHGEQFRKLEGNKFWNVIYSLVEHLKGPRYVPNSEELRAASRSSVVWNTIMRMLGIDGVIDEGSGTVHPNEPYQGVIFDPRSIRHIETIENVQSKGNDQLDLLLQRPKSLEYPEYVLDTAIQQKLSFSYRYQNKYNEIMSNVLEVLTSNPKIYTKLDRAELSKLQSLTDNKKIRKELLLGYIHARFERLKQNLDEQLENWKDIKSTYSNWNNMPLTKKQKLYSIYVKQNVINQAKQMVKDLYTLHSDPAAQKMLNYFGGTLTKFTMY